MSIFRYNGVIKKAKTKRKKVEKMTVSERMKLVHMIEKINANKSFSQKLGVHIASVFKSPEPEKRRDVEC